MKVATLLALGSLLAAPLAADATAAEEVARIFADRAAGETASFLLVMKDQADLSGAESIPDRGERRRFVYEALRSRAESSQRGLLARLSRSGVAHRSFFLVNMIEVEADRDFALALASADEVASVAANKPAPLARPEDREPGIVPSSADAIEESLAKVRAPEAWNAGYTGQGIVIGIADTGVSWEHPALKNRYRGFDGADASHDYNWHDAVHDGTGNPCGTDSLVPCDDLDHGTHVTGTAVGTDGGENRIGVAPGARWIGCRNMNSNVGTPARYTECFEFFLAPTDRSGANPRPDLGADVVNNSWGCPPSEGCTDPNVLRSVVENVRAAGIFVAASAGNDGNLGCSSIDTVPSFYEATFTVGATGLDDGIASFSSRGPVTVDGSGRSKPDVVAPGVGIRSSVPGNGYRHFSGTSMASPHVAGAVALLWSAAPWLAGRIAETENLIKNTAVRLTTTESCGGVPGDAVPNPVFGYGRLDAAAAVTAALGTEPPPPPSPAPRIPSSRGRSGSRTLQPRG